MSFHLITRCGLELRYFDSGQGLPVIFQHGLGGDEAQVAEIFPGCNVWRRITLECRGHGGSAAGPSDALCIATFSDDLVDLADFLGLNHFVVGGISMGAAISLRIAVHHPARVRALVLARPAWLLTSAPNNMRPYGEVAKALRLHGPVAGKRHFVMSSTGQDLERTAPDNYASLLSFFDAPNTEVTANLLSRISVDGPGVDGADLARIGAPTLIIGHRVDFAHPLEYAQKLASMIPQARFQEITPKAVNRAAYVAEFRSVLTRFLSSVP
jgi:pimeloyl-ACP methyl ester carboxylesterase